MKHWITGIEASISDQEVRQYQQIKNLINQPFIIQGNSGYTIDVLKLINELSRDQKIELEIYLHHQLSKETP
jgi:hypothetical protein